MLKAIKIRLYLNDDQINYTNKLFGTSRFIYNKCLSYKINEYKSNNKPVSFGEIGKYLVNLKTEFEWIKDSHSKVLQQSLMNLDQAYKNFFKNKKGFPKFKSKHDNKQSVRFPVDAISGIKGNRINIINALKDIHFKCSKNDERYLNNNQNKIKSATLSKNKSGQIHLSILIDRPNKKLKQPKNIIVGIDLGIKDFIICSEGTKYENLKIKRNNEKKLAKLNRNLSKKQKGSKNKEKSRIKLAKYNNKLNNKKEYYLHSITNHLLSENQTIVMENLNVKGMMSNHKLARSIQELSLNRFKNILTYKSLWYDREVIEIDRWFPSSKLCSCCGYKNNELTLNDREWVCPECVVKHDRDLNAATNILNEGIKIKIGLSSPELTIQDSKSLCPRRMKKEKVELLNDFNHFV